MNRLLPKLTLSLLALVALTGCARVGNLLNPFQDPTAPEATLGERNDKALRGDSQKFESARKALEQTSEYQRALPPQPVNPVMQPAVVRLMWIPDHLNRNGDLVPAHYYYVKVLKDRWAVSDAFELEGQLAGPGQQTSNVPFVPSAEVKGK